MVQKSRKVWPKLDYLQQCKTHSERCKVENMMLTCCQDHIFTENIWFYCLKHRIVEIRGDVTMRDKRQTSEDGATQPMDAVGWVSQWAASSWSASSLYLPAPPGQKDTFFKSHNISSVWLGSVPNSSDGLIFVKIRAKYGRFFSKNTCKIKVFVIVVFLFFSACSERDWPVFQTAQWRSVLPKTESCLADLEVKSLTMGKMRPLEWNAHPFQSFCGLPKVLWKARNLYNIAHFATKLHVFIMVVQW